MLIVGTELLSAFSGRSSRVLCVSLADVKPSNVLINTLGQVKMCDFGISGHLVDSVAKTLDAGCKPYMAVRGFTPPQLGSHCAGVDVVVTVFW